MWNALQGLLHRQARGPQTEQQQSEGASCGPAAAPSPDLHQHPLFGPHGDFADSKGAFLAAASGAYGYQASGSCVDTVRQDELRRLHHQAYLDCGGVALYSERQLGDVFEELSTQLLHNPHSVHGSSGSSGIDAEAELRHLTLDMLHASGQDYEVVLTSGATAAIKLVGECFPWSPTSTLTYTLHNHNSVLGLREFALSAQATVHTVDLLHQDHNASSLGGGTAALQHASAQSDSALSDGDGAVQGSDSGPSTAEHASAPVTGCRLGPYHVQHCNTLRRHPCSSEIGALGSSSSSSRGDSSDSSGPQSGPVHLFALPLECNFSGMRYDLTAACEAQAGGLAHLQQRSGPSTVGGAEASSDFSGPSPPSSSQARGRCLVLVDAAKGCSTAPPDLSAHPVDFVVLSFYKIFGYPTGLGALVVRKDVLPLLRKRYFAGGTVLVSVADEDFVQRRPGHAGLEDGTLPFAAVTAARHGFRFLQRLGGFPAISRHAHSLAQHLAHSLATLRHHNGHPVAEVYGWGSTAAAGVAAGHQEAKCPLQGPTVAFNLLRADGSYVGYAEVRSLAALHGLHLRCGCFCNPGACAKYLGLKGDDLRENFAAGHVCWDDQDLVGGRPTGAVRASLGALTTFEEVHLLLRLIHHYWLAPDASAAQRTGQTAPRAQQAALQAPDSTPAAATPRQAASSSDINGATPSKEQQSADQCTSPLGSPSQIALIRSPSRSTGCLTGLFLYPVKSCAAQQVCTWPVGPTGLLYDREWALLDDSGRVVTQKKCPRMAALSPCVDLSAGTLMLSMPGCEDRVVVRFAARESSSSSSRDVGVAQGQWLEERTASNRPSASPGTDDAGAGCVETIQVCGDRVCGLLVDMQQVALEQAGCSTSSQAAVQQQQGQEAVRQWFQQAMGVPCRLVRQSAGARRTRRMDVRPAGAATATVIAAADGATLANDGSSRGARSPRGASGTEAGSAVGFANDGQYLLVNSASVEDLNARLASSSPRTSAPGTRPLRSADERRFRPNLVVEGFAAYAEDTWLDVQVGPLRLDVLGMCPRCEMLQVDQESGTRGRPDILIELAQYRRQGGKMHFGLLLAAPPVSGADELQAGSGAQGALDTGACGDQADSIGHKQAGLKWQLLSVGMPVVATLPTNN